MHVLGPLYLYAKVLRQWYDRRNNQHQCDPVNIHVRVPGPSAHKGFPNQHKASDNYGQNNVLYSADSDKQFRKKLILLRLVVRVLRYNAVYRGVNTLDIAVDMGE